jgi:hypothetical protein
VNKEPEVLEKCADRGMGDGDEVLRITVNNEVKVLTGGLGHVG